ncbi:hypothetical protein [Sphingopyxis sp. Geo48]|uniref:hypothetical protein n=1 Tax=Sphingopyxis sp. Geo48 TaxID=545241 RepID=UPI0024B8479B|nr:hypothetical protein [Sphingopyxis sp. Geo48]
MKRAPMFVMLVPVLLMSSACGQREAVRTVSDTCLTMKVVRYNPAPAPSADDPGNQYDTDETVKDLIEQNAAWRKLCETR